MARVSRVPYTAKWGKLSFQHILHIHAIRLKLVHTQMHAHENTHRRSNKQSQTTSFGVSSNLKGPFLSNTPIMGSSAPIRPRPTNKARPPARLSTSFFPCLLVCLFLSLLLLLLLLLPFLSPPLFLHFLLLPLLIIFNIPPPFFSPSPFSPPFSLYPFRPLSPSPPPPSTPLSPPNCCSIPVSSTLSRCDNKIDPCYYRRPG